MTSKEMKKTLALIAKYAQTKMLCIDERQRKLLERFAEAMQCK